MTNSKKYPKKYFLAGLAIGLNFIAVSAFCTNIDTNSDISLPTVTAQIFKSAEENDNWKTAILTGKNAQIVLMSVSPKTNPTNEIGMEVHPFDQIILVANGSGKAILDGKTTMIKTGDLVFIPQGIQHNIVNLNQDIPLKIISFYSNRDIPAKSVYPTKADTTK